MAQISAISQSCRKYSSFSENFRTDADRSSNWVIPVARASSLYRAGLSSSFSYSAMSSSNRLWQGLRQCITRSSRSRNTFRIHFVRGQRSRTVCMSAEAEVDASRSKKSSRFGVLLDIDGVLMRGRYAIPGAREALQKLHDSNIPTLFLTNGGCELESDISERLSVKLGIKIESEQVILSHTPMKMLSSLHNEHVLVIGQGPVKQIAEGYGFKNVSDIDDIRQAYPLLDMIDRSRRYNIVNNKESSPQEISPVKAIIMMGEPVRWETNFQLVIDMLLTNGKPACSHTLDNPGKELVVIAANTDLLWMSEAVLPRFGHGAFLHCLESLYKKLTGEDLTYTMLLGKPYLPTYKFAEQCFQESNGPSTVENVYVVGDNVDADVYGANLCNHYVQTVASARSPTDDLKNFCSQTKQSITDWLPVTKKMSSILVRTGVSSHEEGDSEVSGQNFLHKDAVLNYEYRNPNYVVENIENAIDLVFDLEGLR